MKNLAATVLMFFPVVALAQTDGDRTISVLIRNLSSANFHEREAATRALKERPDAVPSLEEAMRAADLETRRRAGEILAFLALRNLNSAVKSGDIVRFMGAAAAWPTGKMKDELWPAARQQVRLLSKALGRQPNPEIGRILGAMVAETQEARFGDPSMLYASRVDEKTKADPYRPFFVRTKELDYDYRKQEKAGYHNQLLEVGALFVVSGSARLNTPTDHQIVFAGGSVELSARSSGDFGPGSVNGVLIVSGGDVTLDCELGVSLVIARGKVVCNSAPIACRICAGKSVTVNKGVPEECLISENDPNPLGYIRWSDAPKDKAAPKAK